MSLDRGLTIVANTGIVASAAFQALDAALAGRPNARALFSFMDAPFAQYVPLILVGIAGLAWIAKRILPSKKKGAIPEWEDSRFTIVRDRHYANERVLMDGTRFEKCHFSNVTLVYNGTAPTETFECKLAPGTTNLVVTESRPLDSMMRLLSSLHAYQEVEKVLIMNVDKSTGKRTVTNEIGISRSQDEKDQGKKK
jgi:hypothetical protein